MDNAPAYLDNAALIWITHMDNCPQCGASYALVGRVHNCRPRTTGYIQVQDRAEIAVAETSPAAPSGTYKYRDPVKRRAQVADAMRKYRAKKRGTT